MPDYQNWIKCPYCETTEDTHVTKTDDGNILFYCQGCGEEDWAPI